jgi:hypothetical protein
MLLAIIIAAPLLASFVYDYWRATNEREVRWGIYALRDELRWLAAEDRTLLESQLFWDLDRSLTNQCARLSEMSMWDLLARMLSEPEEPDEWSERFRRDLTAPGNEHLRDIFTRSIGLLLKHMTQRHFVAYAGLSLMVRASSVPNKVAEYAATLMACLRPAATAS